MAGGYREGVLYEKQVIGGGYRPNARCPKCFSLDRERQILVVLNRDLKLQQDSRVLHVAPERNLNEVIRRTMTTQVDECDLEPESYAWAPNITKQDLTKLTYDDEQFDLVLCNHVMEHIPNDLQAQAELLCLETWRSCDIADPLLRIDSKHRRRPNHHIGPRPIEALRARLTRSTLRA